MHRTYDGMIDEKGNVRLLEPIDVKGPRRVLVTVLEAREDEEMIHGVPVPKLLSALARDWSGPEEDEAWKDFQ